VIARNQGRASIAPQGVLRLDAIAVKPPAPTASGPVFIELQLFNAENVLLTERIHVFGLAMQGSLGGLLKNRTQDADDNNVELPNGPANLAYVGNGAKPATASSARVEDIHQSCGLNDGQYGNSHSWIGKDFVAWCEVDLGKPAVIGRFKLGRDRLGLYKDREIDYVKIETSTDEKQWKKVYEKSGIAALPDYRAENNIEILIAPTQAQFVKLTVNPRMIPGITANEMTCVDELEVYTSKADYRGKVPHLLMTRNECIVHPVRRTTLTIAAKPMQIDGDQELLELAVTNTGPLTALFCEPHPLLVYRTDLQIDNNHCFIPPGETRVMTICASRQSPCGLSLGQTGWRISTWNADDLLVEPNTEVLLSVGRRDQMCREFRGYADPCGIPKNQKTVCEGRRPNAAQVPYRLEDGDSIQFRFALDAALAKRPARLRIHAADQSKRTPTSVEVVLNGRTLQGVLPLGIGVQYDDPSHLAFPATLELPIAAADLRTGKNVLQIQVRGGGWFSWDALDLLSDTHSSLQQ
jgi:hypothetical protein